MATLDSLPAIDDCLETYLTAHAAFGDGSFSAGALEDHDGTVESTTPDLERRLALLVAYGLLEQLDADRYRVRCSPEDRPEQWRERATERAEMLHRLVSDLAADRRDSTESDDANVELLEWNGESFASVFVSESDDAESVATRAATVLARTESAGIVLRTSGARAGRAQQIADQLCSDAIVDDTSLDRPFEKEGSDVVGDSKDDLDFRAFLRST